jgi:hypothetical protein
MALDEIQNLNLLSYIYKNWPYLCKWAIIPVLPYL